MFLGVDMKLTRRIWKNVVDIVVNIWWFWLSNIISESIVLNGTDESNILSKEFYILVLVFSQASSSLNVMFLGRLNK